MTEPWQIGEATRLVMRMATGEADGRALLVEAIGVAIIESYEGVYTSNSNAQEMLRMAAVEQALAARNADIEYGLPVPCPVSAVAVKRALVRARERMFDG